MSKHLYCPECKREYDRAAGTCEKCNTKLMEKPADGGDDNELFTAYATGNPALLGIAKSILDDAGIPYMAKGELLQNLFALGTYGSGFNPLSGPTELLVRAGDLKLAQELLEELDGVEEESG